MSQDLEVDAGEATSGASNDLSREWPWKRSVEADVDEHLSLNAWLLSEQVAALGATQMTVKFRGEWDSKLGLEIDEDSGVADLLKETVAIYSEVELGSVELTLREMTLGEALDQFVDAFSDEHHSGYHFNAGGGGELTFDLDRHSITAKLKERREISGDDVECGSESASLLEGLSDRELQMPMPDAEGNGSYSTNHSYQPINQRILMAALKREGVTSVNCAYSGFGDDGSLDSPDFFFGADDDGAVLSATLLDRTLTVAQFDHRGYPSPVTLADVVKDLMNAEVSKRHSGYEDGEGGNGHVSLNVLSAEISWTGYNTGDCDYETDVTGHVVIDGVQPAAAAALRP